MMGMQLVTKSSYFSAEHAKDLSASTARVVSSPTGLLTVLQFAFIYGFDFDSGLLVRLYACIIKRTPLHSCYPEYTTLTQIYHVSVSKS